MWRQLCGGRDLCRKFAASAWRSAAHAAQHGRRASPWRPLAMLERRASRGWAVEPCSEGQRTKNHFGKKMMAREWLFATCAHRRGRWSTDIIRFYIGAFEHGSSRASGPTSEAARGRMAGRAGAPQREPLVDEIGRLRRGVLATRATRGVTGHKSVTKFSMNFTLPCLPPSTHPACLRTATRGTLTGTHTRYTNTPLATERSVHGPSLAWRHAVPGAVLCTLPGRGSPHIARFRQRFSLTL